MSYVLNFLSMDQIKLSVGCSEHIMNIRFRYYVAFICVWVLSTIIVSLLYANGDIQDGHNNEMLFTALNVRKLVTRNVTTELGLSNVLAKPPYTRVSDLQKTKLVLQSLDDRHHERIGNGSKTERPSNDVQSQGQSKSKPLSRFEMEDAYFTPGSKRINPLEGGFVISNKKFCVDVVPYLLIIVPSVHRNAEVRHAIRNTYGTWTKNNVSLHGNITVKLMFLFGTATEKLDEDILQENRKYGDIVQADFKDSYANLTRKILYGLKWVSIYCSEVEFVGKIDEDVFTNVQLLVNYLQNTYYDMNGAVYGYIYNDSPVQRAGRWKVTKEQYPLKRYPNYASGNSYVISGNIVSRLFMVSEYMPYLPIEDAFITGCLVKVIGAKHMHNPKFTHWLMPAPNPCTFALRKRISATKVTISMFYKLWDTIQSNHTVCQKTPDNSLPPDDGF